MQATRHPLQTVINLLNRSNERTPEMMSNREMKQLLQHFEGNWNRLHAAEHGWEAVKHHIEQLEHSLQLTLSHCCRSKVGLSSQADSTGLADDIAGLQGLHH